MTGPLNGAPIGGSQALDLEDVQVLALDTPYTAVANDNGRLFILRPEAGALVFNLPALADVPLGWNTKAMANDAANGLTVTPAGADPFINEGAGPTFTIPATLAMTIVKVNNPATSAEAWAVVPG